jgi:filamentous hemagglutinin family protein
MKTISGLQEGWKLSVVNSLVLGGAITLMRCFAISNTCALWAIAVSGNYAVAQVASDNTLGAESSLVTSPRPGAFQIDGGATRGTNLFHSFSEFSVPSNGAAYFNNALNIQNIMTRVTGGSVSNIDGLITANGTANLFLLNPNGIIFGLNASLNIGGSFLGSTASSLTFADSTQFSGTATQTTPLLTISVPLGLQYEGNAGSLRVQGSKLKVPHSKTLALVGGNVELNDAFLQAPGGRIELGGVAGSGTIGLEADNGSLRLSVSQGLARTDVLLNGGTIDVVAGSGGSITIYGENLTIENTLVRSGIEQSPGGGNTGGNFPGGGNTAGNFPGSGNAPGVSNNIGGGDALSGGNDGGTTPTGLDGVTLVGVGSGLLANTDPASTGNGGSIFISSSRSIILNGASVAVDSKGTGQGGNVQIQADSLVINNKASISAETTSNRGGNITLQVQELLLIRHGSSISTTAGTARAGGDGGNIVIDADFIVAVPKENSDISANAFTGRGGNINITAHGIYGIELRPQDTPLSDITASSRFGVSGVVIINTPDVDPSRGLANLPVEPVNVEVAQDCQAGGNQASIGFFNTGRGGLAPNPYEPISSSDIWEDVPSATQRTELEARAVPVSAAPATPPDKIVEAQGWRINQKGEVVLVAEVPTTGTQSRCRLR